ncbi:hypothetical protein ACU4GH_01030 [Bradyrhizobium betae]
MLLLVVEPDLDQRRDVAAACPRIGLAEEFDDGRIDVSAIGADLIGARDG